MIGAAVVLAGCATGHGRPPIAAAGQVAGVSAGSAKGRAGDLAESLARASKTVRPANRPGSPVHFRVIAYYPIITNAGTRYGFAVFVRVVRDVRVLSSSAAELHVAGEGPPRLAPRSERAWRAAGRPALPHFPAKPVPVPLLAGTYSFIPQGKVLTYHDATSLPTSAAALTREIRAMLAGYAGPHPLPTQMLTQFGYLLAAAPLTAGSRAAAWMSVATMPGLRQCPESTDLVGRRGRTICVSVGGHETELIVDPASGSVLAVEDRLVQRSPDYPGISPGSLVESATFTTGSCGRSGRC